MDIIAIIYLFIAFLLLAWTTDFIPFIKTAKQITGLSQSSLETIQSEKIDDSAKQKILLGNSLGILKHSLLIILFTSLLIGLLFLLLEASVLIKPLSFEYLTEYLVSIEGIVLSVFSFLSYFLIKSLYVKFRV